MYPIAALYLKPEKMAWAGARVREYFSLDADTQIILYAPTFRGYGETTEMLLDFQRCLEIFAEQGKRHDDTASAPKKYVLLWRLHPNLANRCREQIQNPSVVNATNYPDIYELDTRSRVFPIIPPAFLTGRWRASRYFSIRRICSSIVRTIGP